MYQLVFKGELVAGTDEATARANVRELFKAGDEQVARMFSGERVVIRNRLDDAAAKKYQALLFKQGLVCRIEAMQAAGGAPPGAKASTPGSSAGRASFGERQPAGASEPRPAAPKAESPKAKPAGPQAAEGGRLDLSGERAGEILANSSLDLAPPGETLSQPRETEPPVFEHLDDWTLAPAGADLGEKHERPPVAEPDISHLRLSDPD